MGGGLDESDRARLSRLGITPLSSEQGLELFDIARAMDDPLLIPVRLTSAALRAQAKAGILPALLRGLIRAPARRAAEAGGSLARRLAGVPENERDALVLGLVRSHVAGVLGHASVDAIESERAFKELGFDSLAAVELRNRLATATGLRLPATLVFDYPNCTTAACYLREQAQGGTNYDPPEANISQAIASIPLSVCRSAGLLKTLLELANPTASSTDLPTAITVTRPTRSRAWTSRAL